MSHLEGLHDPQGTLGSVEHDVPMIINTENHLWVTRGKVLREVSQNVKKYMMEHLDDKCGHMQAPESPRS